MIGIKKLISKIYLPLRYYLYKLYITFRIPVIRKKSTIKVLFVICEVSSWKSELLYLTMLKHPRFNPILGVSTCSIPPNTKSSLINYLKSKKYDYYDLDLEKNSIDKISPDIIFYYKPYSPCYSPGHFFNKNLRYVFCGMDYCFSTTKHIQHIELAYYDYCWLFFTEHNDVANYRRKVLGYKAKNVRVTGVPMQDILMLNKKNFNDPWKDKMGRKRIIYAPHHSVKGTNGKGIEFATFLDYGEPILQFAKKYKDVVTMAFKPHPNLYMKLINIWGQKKTDDYYNEWEKLSNTQIETGEYVGLFKYSDAIIHDCSSFIVEYLYINKPSLYLVADTNKMDDMFDFVLGAFNRYEHGCSVSDIESFITNVIAGIDVKKEERQIYVQHQLLPPNGKTACENIVNTILGVN